MGSLKKHPFDTGLETFANNLFGSEDERRETCFQCGLVWSSKHFKDGLCYGCQEKCLPGRSVIQKRNNLSFILLGISIVSTSLVVLYFVVQALYYLWLVSLPN